MQPFIITTLISTAALTAAAPHALNHFKLHQRALDVEARAVELTPLAGRSVVTTENFKPPYDLTIRDVDLSISPTGQCGGSSGFQCAPGFCCSQYGYCGKGPKYCGGGGASSAAPAYSAPPSYSSPAQSSAAAPSESWAPSSAAAPSGSSAPAPSSYAPAPSSAAAPSGSSSPSSYAPAPSSSGSPGGGGYGNTYKMYSGDGSPSQGWPSTSDWMDFEGLWEANLPVLQASCSQFGQADNSDQENDELKSAIQSAASQYGIDERFILSVVMQESKGCVRVWTTDNGVTNPGLMQSHDGDGSCNDDSGVADPCPPQEIQQMITDGVKGTAAGDGLERIMPQCTGTDEAQRYYQAGTIYNSGSLPQNLDDNTATACYASDIANRLTGWVDAPTSCNL